MAATMSNPVMIRIVLDKLVWGLKGCITVLYLKENLAVLNLFLPLRVLLDQSITRLLALLGK